MASTSKLFKPIRVGQSDLAHRIALAPLTRMRADKTHAPLQPLVSEYYGQRACVPGTLLVSEAVFISAPAGGYADVPGIWSDAQIASWKQVTAAVHANKSSIYCQLWALGRVASRDVLVQELGPDAKVVGPSDIPSAGGEKPTPLTEDEIRQYIAWYVQAAKNAIAAGFDGVEIHGANGYLIDQFTQDVSNNRTDAWGGSIENRARFALEITQAVVDAVGADRTAIRLAPFSEFQNMKMADPKPQFTHVVQELNKLKLAYLHLVEARIAGNEDVEASEKLDDFVNAYDGPLLLAGGFKPDSAVKTVEEEYPNKDVIIVFGRLFISNPDLAFRIQKGIGLTPYDRSKFYLPGSPDGYITPPFSKEYLESVAAK
ncbi:unnamed protein product [Discula destructiva]